MEKQIVTLKEIEDKCYKLAYMFNATCDLKAYFLLEDELSFYSDVYKDEYGVRPRNIFWEIHQKIIQGQADVIARSIRMMGWEKYEKLRDELLA